jgi:hypothetical protein
MTKHRLSLLTKSPEALYENQVKEKDKKDKSHRRKFTQGKDQGKGTSFFNLQLQSSLQSPRAISTRAFLYR